MGLTPAAASAAAGVVDGLLGAGAGGALALLMTAAAATADGLLGAGAAAAVALTSTAAAAAAGAVCSPSCLPDLPAWLLGCLPACQPSLHAARSLTCLTRKAAQGAGIRCHRAAHLAELQTCRCCYCWSLLLPPFRLGRLWALPTAHSNKARPAVRQLSVIPLALMRFQAGAPSSVPGPH